jgi:hypothetical protein
MGTAIAWYGAGVRVDRLLASRVTHPALIDRRLVSRWPELALHKQPRYPQLIHTDPSVLSNTIEERLR